MNNALESKTVGLHTVHVVHDNDPQFPWEWDSGAVYVDIRSGEIMGTNDRISFLHWYITDERLAVIRKHFHPLALRYGSTGDYAVVVTADSLNVVFGDAPETFPGENRSRACSIAFSCENILNQCLNGEVYGYVVTGPDGDTLDSGYGFIGDIDEAMAEGVHMAEHYDARLVDSLIANASL